jgi:hypothetical protein
MGLRGSVDAMSVPQSLRALLAHSIDYAGTFPPCSLDLDLALENQSHYVRSQDAWMLGAFILGVDQFTAAKEQLAEFDPKNPLRVSALGPKTENATAFRAILPKIVSAIQSLSAHNVDLLVIEQFEMLLPPDADLDLVKYARSLVGRLTTFWEAHIDKAAHTIALLAEHNSDTDSVPFGYKLRTGGVTEDAFPSSAQIAQVLVLPADYQVPIKFTAGLHHPIRQFREEVQTKMHGFLNVLGAAVLAAEHRWNEEQTARMLDDEDVGSFSFTEDSFSWREWAIHSDRLKARRKFVTSFGSCSFDEPCEDLRALGLL